MTNTDKASSYKIQSQKAADAGESLSGEDRSSFRALYTIHSV